jgi:Vitamin K-dependent gamma-carboxylase
MSILPGGDIYVVAFFVLHFLASVSLALGFCTRTSAFIVFITMVSMNHRNLLIVNSGDTFLRIMAFFFIFSQAGAAYSLDRLIRIKSGKEVGPPPKSSPWAQRLMQYQLSLVYLMGAIWKLEGFAWVYGNALYYVSRLEEFWRFPVPYVFEHMWTIKLLTWVTLVIEGALGTLIWSRRYRYYVIAAGVFLHLGIEYTMNIPLFEWMMITALVLFIRPDDLKKAIDKVRQRVKGMLEMKSLSARDSARGVSESDL